MKRYLLAAVCCGLAVSCGGSDGGDAGEPEDAGPSKDAGAPVDAGLDAGLPLDAGVHADAGLDAGVDAGRDAGLDAGIDAGLDAGAGFDAGSGGLDCASCHPVASLSGAHAQHVQAGALSQAISCSECHVVPTVTPHAASTLAVTFATAAGDVANLGGLTPTWTKATATCSNVYCHGAKSSGGAATSPVWTTVDGSQARCDSCHGNPPSANAHVAAGTQFCSACHLTIGETNGVIDPKHLGLHVDGLVEQAALGHPLGWTPPGHPSPNWSLCTTCHTGADTMSSPGACTVCHTKNGF